MNNLELTQQIQIIEKLITDTKATLKTWANQIGKYHKQLQEFTNQLATLKKQIETNMNKQNNKPKTQGGKK